MKCLKKATTVVLALILILSMTIFVDAARNTVNVNRNGSIFISASDPRNNKPLDGGSFVIYKVAELQIIDGDYVFVPTAKFAAGGFDLSNFSSPSLVNEISEYVFDSFISPLRTATLKNGVAYFGTLGCGLYLIEQDTPTPGYFPINSFLVSLPMLIGDEYVYDINATPKIEQVEPENPGHRPPGDNFDTDRPGDNPPDDNPPGTPGSPSDNINPGDDFYYDEETPPDVILEGPDESNLVDFEKADITLRLFSADYSPMMKVALAVLGVIAAILIAILVFDKKSEKKKKAE